MAYGFSEYVRGIASLVAVLLGMVAFSYAFEPIQKLIIVIAVIMGLWLFNAEWRGLS